MTPERGAATKRVWRKSGILRHVWNWLNRPRSVKFWLLAGGAVVAVLLEVGAIRAAVEWWGVSYRTCGPGCVESGPPLSSGILALAYMVGLFTLAAVLVWLAARAYLADPRER